MKAAKEVLWFSLAVFFGLNNVCAAEVSPQDFKDLKQISFFGSISVSVHLADSANSANLSDLSSEELTQFMRIQFARYFPGTPFGLSTYPTGLTRRTEGQWVACRAGYGSRVTLHRLRTRSSARYRRRTT